MATKGNEGSARGAPDVKMVGIGAVVAGNEPIGSELVVAVFSNMIGS
jgi:hypothetical protein